MNQGRFKNYRSLKNGSGLGKAIKKASQLYIPKQAAKPVKPSPKPPNPDQKTLF